MQVQLFIQLFNKLNCWYLEGLKVFCMEISIFHGYLGIRPRYKHPLMAGYCALSHVITIVVYCGAFQRAYRLKELQKKMKRKLNVARRGRSSGAGDIVRKEVGKAVKALSCP